MSLQPPLDNNVYVDSGASYHMSFKSVNMPCLSLRNSRSLIVAKGAILHITQTGQIFFPHSHNCLALNSILVSNKIVKNLINVCQFTVDNFVSVTFDPFGFTVKDFKTCAFI